MHSRPFRLRLPDPIPERKVILMSLNPTTWNAKMLAGYVITAIVVIALAHPIIDLAIGVLTAIKGFVPGMK